MSDTTRKPRQRRDATEQAADIEKSLRRARMTFIAEGNEPMAEAMHKIEKALTAELESEAHSAAAE